MPSYVSHLAESLAVIAAAQDAAAIPGSRGESLHESRHGSSQSARPASGAAASSAASAATLIGCAGWSIAKPTADAFAGDGSHLERYARVLPAVEINSSFYRPHQPATYARWAASVPAGFRFSVKLPKLLSHEHGLRETGLPLARFASEVAHLGEKLGCILVQLPPSLACEAVIAGQFFAALHAHFDCLLACEARHPTWFDPAATRLLMQHGVVRVAADPAPGQPGAHEPTAASVYLRLHGTPQRYYSAYAVPVLAQVAQTLQAVQSSGNDAWCIFDNTAGGAALPDALQLLQLLSAIRSPG